MTKTPFRQPDVKPAPLQKGPWHPLGFVQTVQGKCATLKREIESVYDRLKYPAYRDGVPASYVGERIFSPEDQLFTLDIFGRGDDVATQQPVNYVIRDGQLQTVPIEIDGPGVFMARYLKVVFYQRWFDPNTQQPIQISIPQTKSFDNLNTTDSTRLSTIKWSILAQQTFSALPSTNVFGIDYFWNLLDTGSDRRLCTELIGNQVLLPRSYRNQTDGGLFEFDTPWLFQRRGRMDFEFQLITPIVQLDPTAALFPFITAVGAVNIDDRESGNTVRNQEVLVRAELHGTKFYNDKDILYREAV